VRLHENEHVRVFGHYGLEITMDDAFLMRMLDSVAYFEKEAQPRFGL
jgi:hypothetical protein